MGYSSSFRKLYDEGINPNSLSVKSSQDGSRFSLWANHTYSCGDLVCNVRYSGWFKSEENANKFLTGYKNYYYKMVSCY